VEGLVNKEKTKERYRAVGIDGVLDQLEAGAQIWDVTYLDENHSEDNDTDEEDEDEEEEESEMKKEEETGKE